MSTIHWVGAGLASGPGIVELAGKVEKLTVWDMTSERADMLRQEVGGRASFGFSELNLSDPVSVDVFKVAIAPGDIIVSMLPAALHVRIAELAIEVKANLVTSSYVSPEMAELDERAKEAGVVLINEVGLDPGIDHLFAHVIVDAAKEAGVLGQGNALEFVSYCGGVPAEETDFTYKFAWTPYGVLTALKNEAVFLEDGATKSVAKAWDDVSDLNVDGETFEVYANRDSLPYIEEYGLGGESNLQKFVRGTLRLGGWKHAWQDIFAKVEASSDNELKALSDDLWQAHAYAEDEQDRVILYVALNAVLGNGEKWSASLALDEKGAGWQTAMARTVSLTVAQAVVALTKQVVTPGVHAAITGAGECREWLAGLRDNGITIKAENVRL